MGNGREGKEVKVLWRQKAGESIRWREALLVVEAARRSEVVRRGATTDVTTCVGRRFRMGEEAALAVGEEGGEDMTVFRKDTRRWSEGGSAVVSSAGSDRSVRVYSST